MITWTITTRNDVRTYVEHAHPDFAEHGLTVALVDAICEADHPLYGRDWTEWLEEHVGAIGTRVLAHAKETIDVTGWAARMARDDAKACELAGTQMDAIWSGEHTSALADLLGCSVPQILDEDMECARKGYEHEARRLIGVRS